MKVVTITSGKGGVGKTNIAVNLALALSSKGFKTCLFDADIGLANINILMGIAVEHTLEDVIFGAKKLHDIVISWNGIDIIPGSSGVEKFRSMSDAQLSYLIGEFSGLEEYDYLIVDTGAGISQSVISFSMASDILIFSIVPEPTSLTDAYSLLKVINHNGFDKPIQIITNRCKKESFGIKIFEKFRESAKKFIDVNLQFLGNIPEDDNIPDSVTRQIPFIFSSPDAPASKGLLKIADTLLKLGKNNSLEKKSMNSFISIYTEFFKSKLKIPENKKSKIKVEENSHQKKNEEKIIDLLNKLVNNTAQISKDLSIISKALSNENTAGEKQELINTPQEEVLPPVLTLNFEKFIKKKKSGDELN